MTAARSIVDAVSALRVLGFFADPDATDAEVAAAVVDDHLAMWGRPLSPDDELLDLELLRFDPARVWWEDTEADVGAGNGAYVEALEGWATISRGALEPADVTESWETPRGPVRIRFVHGGRRHELVARYLGDHLDMAVLDQLNDVIAGSPYRFRMLSPFDQTAFVIACTAPERRGLEERGWSFARASRVTPPQG